ncbi:MAG: biotin--[acetyl-CoA-carboxylase] ligase [Candidatus Aminicenantes bacterium]|nr:MAG: biotin--[acetyl-CoA-carboxylase] ligase [Candidatus Aminicenantes bacterium]
MDYSTTDPNLGLLMKELYCEKSVYKRQSRCQGRWSYGFIVKKAPSSHFDHLIQLSQRNIELPDGIICQAGSGHKFHGQRGRPWAAPEGNIHLSVYLAPKQKIKGYHIGFPVLAAVSLIETLNAMEGLEGRAKIKWVNDVLIDGAKVAGFLVHTLSSEDTVIAAILGIGLNVEKAPRVKPDPFFPKVASLRKFVQDSSISNRKKVLMRLLACLDNNYNHLLEGKYQKLLDSYRKCSLVIGQSVKILSDTPGKGQKEIASGIVRDIGENLELFLEGEKKPVTKGRLILTRKNHSSCA